MINDVYFDSPLFYDNKYDFFHEGSSPKILEKLISFINAHKNKIKSITISLYIYNNPKLHLFFKNLIKETNIYITIISIPLEGYDNTNPKELKYINTFQKTKAYTKYEIAKKVYNDILSLRSPQYKLYIFPHMYIRSKYIKPFSRGQLPYSLHCKLFLFEYSYSEKATIGITSSNLAARDLVKYENFLFINISNKILNGTQSFFKDLLLNSIPVENFNNTVNYYNYKIRLLNNIKDYNFIFTAPFYNNSSMESESFLIRLIQSAKERIYIVAQHISSYEYTYTMGKARISRKGILWHTIKKAKEGVALKCLSQTFVDNAERNSIFRKPSNKKSFLEFISAFKNTKNCSYATNPSIHSKYIIIDNKLIITTCNFTPTQFIYIKNVEIDEFKNIPGLKYKGIHAEVGAYFIIDEQKIVNKYIDNMNEIWDEENTKIIQ